MEESWELSAEPYDAHSPVVCFDEAPSQLGSEVRQPLPPLPGKPAREDDADRREGTCHVCRCLPPLAGWRPVEVTERRTAQDCAYWMQAVGDVPFPQAELITVVLDHLHPQPPAALYATFPPAEARRLVRNLDVRYTPTHASWRNMAELEWAVLQGPCLDRRLPDLGTGRRAVGAWEAARKATKATVQWRFTVANARTKRHPLYPL